MTDKDMLFYLLRRMGLRKTEKAHDDLGRNDYIDEGNIVTIGHNGIEVEFHFDNNNNLLYYETWSN